MIIWNRVLGGWRGREAGAGGRPARRGEGRGKIVRKFALRELIKRGYGSLERLWFSGMKAFRSVNDAGNSPKRA